MKNISDIVDYQQCNGCGACSYIAPDSIRMVDFEDYGIRPVETRPLTEKEQASAIKVCSGISLSHDKSEYSTDINEQLFDMWGPVLEVYEGYATDSHSRWKGSSGGLLTALSLFAVDKGEFSGVLHTVPSKSDPVVNRAHYSTTREDILRASGSRYAPSSPLSKLSEVVSRKNSVVIGKPCDIAALYKLQKENQAVANSVGVSLAFFCAGVPSTTGNREYIKNQLGCEPTNIHSLKYRGEGWPGVWRVNANIDDVSTQSESSYAESWSVLQKSRQWRCYICPDHSGEFADISVGDPWYREVKDGEPGSSLIVVRSEKGRKYLNDAVSAGFITLIKADSSLIEKSQPNLIAARGGLWGRLLMLKLSGAPRPSYNNFKFFKYWIPLSFSLKKSSIFGTIKRIFVKKMHKRISISRQDY
ncbi:Coenzyme F420 hydrogenase/dehydrogenase, beta subunit C-terminal domain [Amphritea sp. HPY]|uniref:Coenzyme F420 hydrogenase/dehydrogenase, beta subunit C-terminal domain n=1 Tax=Amphritea sp. HPY TaxID=3421652 RepID=UPI003D7D4DF8